MAQAKRKRTPAGPRILKYEAIELRAIGIALRVRLRKMGFCESRLPHSCAALVPTDWAPRGRATCTSPPSAIGSFLRSWRAATAPAQSRSEVAFKD